MPEMGKLFIFFIKFIQASSICAYPEKTLPILTQGPYMVITQAERIIRFVLIMDKVFFCVMYIVMVCLKKEYSLPELGDSLEATLQSI